MTKQHVIPAGERRESILYIRPVPQDLKDQFKAWCARRGLSMTEKIIELMRETITIDRRIERRAEREATQ